MKWSDSQHWNKEQTNRKKQTRKKKTEEVREPLNPELPKLKRQYTAKEIEDAIKDDARFNSMNPNDQNHIINMTIAKARMFGMLRK